MYCYLIISIKFDSEKTFRLLFHRGVDVLSCGILLDRLHHGSRDQAPVPLNIELTKFDRIQILLEIHIAVLSRIVGLA